MLKIAFVIAFVIFPALGGAAHRAQPYQDWLDVPSEQLISEAWSYSQGECISDSTIVCLTFVANRYERKSSDEEKQWCIKACLDLWRIYFYHYYDYSKCFECLVKAKRIADSFDAEIPEIEMNFGCMYQTIAEQSHDKSLNRKALECYLRAFNQTIGREDKVRLLDDIFVNLAFVAFSLGDTHAIADEWDRYKVLPVAPGNYYRQYNHLLYEGQVFLAEKKYAEAVAAFDRQLAIDPGENRHIRHLYVAMTNKARVYLDLEDYAATLKTLKEAEKIAMESNMKDMQLDVYELLAGCYRHIGNAGQKEVYQDKYISQKDSLINYRQLAGISEVQFLGKLDRMNDEMSEMKEKKYRQDISLLISGVVIVVVLSFLIMFYRNNRKLQHTNKMLYQKNAELLKAEDRNKWLRQQYEPLADMAGDNKEDSEESVKYRNSSLDESTKEDLHRRILSAMDNMDDVCAPDFSVELLAQRVDSKYKYVSQVIHEKYDCNFNVFVNEYRIREACKRMADKANYGNLTIEAIANSVGFRSRSSFVQSFKRITGLTPSDYQRLAKADLG